MCSGELDISDFIKLIGSLAQSGLERVNNHISQRRMILTISLYKKICPNFDFKAIEDLNPPIILLPLKWRSIK